MLDDVPLDELPDVALPVLGLLTLLPPWLLELPPDMPLPMLEPPVDELEEPIEPLPVAPLLRDVPPLVPLPFIPEFEPEVLVDIELGLVDELPLVVDPVELPVLPLCAKAMAEAAPMAIAEAMASVRCFMVVLSCAAIDRRGCGTARVVQAVFNFGKRHAIAPSRF